MMSDKKLIRNSTAEFLIFTAQDGKNTIEARYEDETIWLTQKLMWELFAVGTNTINYHLKEIFRSNEVEESSVVRKFRITASDGKTYNTNFYNLDAIISVGYRVNSVRATQFRQWATKVLREFAIKGFVLDKKRLENGSYLNENYFEELLSEIRKIRLSERKFYQKVTDIYATSLDYNKDAKTTKEFFAKVQNKLHYGIHGRTAAELVYERADSKKDYMGLTSWKNSHYLPTEAPKSPEGDLKRIPHLPDQAPKSPEGDLKRIPHLPDQAPKSPKGDLKRVPHLPDQAPKSPEGDLKTVGNG